MPGIGGKPELISQAWSLGVGPQEQWPSPRFPNTLVYFRKCEKIFCQAVLSANEAENKEVANHLWERISV